MNTTKKEAEVHTEKTIEMVDKAIRDISGRDLVSTLEMTDLLLDIRLYLITQASTPEYSTNESS